MKKEEITQLSNLLEYNLNKCNTENGLDTFYKICAENSTIVYLCKSFIHYYDSLCKKYCDILLHKKVCIPLLHLENIISSYKPLYELAKEILNIVNRKYKFIDLVLDRNKLEALDAKSELLYKKLSNYKDIIHLYNIVDLVIDYPEIIKICIDSNQILKELYDSKKEVKDKLTISDKLINKHFTDIDNILEKYNYLFYVSKTFADTIEVYEVDDLSIFEKTENSHNDDVSYPEAIIDYFKNNQVCNKTERTDQEIDKLVNEIYDNIKI